MAVLLAFLVFYPMAGALVSYGIGRRNKNARDYFADFIVAGEFAIAVILCATLQEDIHFGIGQFAGFGLHFVMDGFRGVYVSIAAFMWMMTTVFSREYFRHYHNRNRYYFFMLFTLGATVGVFLSADLYTAFIFFEIMSFTSYVWVAHDEKKASLRAAETYLAVAVIGGMAMLMGLFLLYHTVGSLEIARLPKLAAECQDKVVLYVAGACISIGFGAKAGSFPLHIWLPKAHPVAPAPASALLSGILTKSGIFGLLAVSCNLFLYDGMWGSAVLLIGIVTMAGGAVLALFSVDLKRTLACSSMSQIGFIMVGIGMQGLLGEENVLAARGTVLHMVNHSLIKLVLFMAAGVVFMDLHQLNLNDIRGFGRKKPLLNIIFLMGALGIGGIPLWNGYVSKTLLHESIVEYIHILRQGGGMGAGLLSVAGMKWAEWIFLISGGITVAYMAKLYLAIFVEKNEDGKKQEHFDRMGKYMNGQSVFALAGSALLLPLMGLLPGIVMDPVADRGVSIMNTGVLRERIPYFSFGNLKGAFVSIAIGAALYGFVVRPLLMQKTENGRRYVDRWPSFLDLENYLYRPAITFFCLVGGFFSRICDSLVDTFVVFLRKAVYFDRPLPFELQEGTRFTYHLGNLLNAIQAVRERRNPERKKRHCNYVHKLAMIYMDLKENRNVIVRSLSFGLTFSCLGLILTIAYLLLLNR